jgi:outer membrane protein TolC
MKRLIFLIFLCLMISSYVFAQEKGRVFSLKDAIEYALKNSPDIKNAAANIEKTAGGRIKVRAGLLPQINLNSSYTNYQEEHAIVPGISGTEERFDNDVISGKAEADLLITDFGKSFYAYKSAKENYLASIKNLERKKETVIYTVANIYFNTVSLDKLITVLEAVQKSISELQRRVESYLKEGKVAKIDLLKVNVRLSEIENEIAKLKSKRVYLLGLLSQEMGYEGELKINKKLQLFSIDLNRLSFQKAFNKAVENREDLAEYRNLVKSSYFGLKSSKRAYLPQVKAFGGIGEFSGTSSDSKFAGDDRWEDDYWAGVKVNIPIFDSGKREGDILKARGEYNSKKAKARKILLGVYKDVKKATADILSSEKRLSLAKASKKEAEETLRLEKLKYKVGKGVINDVLDAEAGLRKADYLYYSAISDYNSSVFELYLSEGVLFENYGLLVSGEKSHVENKNSKN